MWSTTVCANGLSPAPADARRRQVTGTGPALGRWSVARPGREVDVGVDQRMVGRLSDQLSLRHPVARELDEVRAEDPVDAHVRRGRTGRVAPRAAAGRTHRRQRGHAAEVLTLLV